MFWVCLWYYCALTLERKQEPSLILISIYCVVHERTLQIDFKATWDVLCEIKKQ